MSAARPYAYSVPNSQLITSLHLEKHFEGGYFAQTVSLESAPSSLSPDSALLPTSKALDGRAQHAVGSGADLLPSPPPAEGDKKVDATCIYYLLTPDSYRGRMHMNLHATFHIHHAGRALYTLIQPHADATSPPTIKRIVMGDDAARGEVRQLFVPGGWWKASEIPEEDLLLASTDKDNSGCLISEVVVPGWNPDQHQFIDEDKMKAMWKGDEGWKEYARYIKAPEGLEYPEK
ncbi:uncharacterized protein P7C73_g6485, partial [Tremellales sp. Uapishka_1]